MASFMEAPKYIRTLFLKNDGETLWWVLAVFRKQTQTNLFIRYCGTKVSVFLGQLGLTGYQTCVDN